MADELQLLGQLARKGVEFSICVPHECGGMTVSLTPEAVLRFVCDPEETYAAAYGVTKSDYLAWMNAGCCVDCAATTKRGRPCANPVMRQASVKLWLELQGEYCVIHGGERH